MSCRFARTFRICDKIPLCPRDSCRSISRRRYRNHRHLVRSLPAPSEKFRWLPDPLATSLAMKPPPMSAAVCDSSMAWDCPSSARAAARSTTALISMREMQQDKCRGRAWKETVWPVNVDSTAARIRGSGGLGLVLSDGRRVCQSTGCINRTDAESYVVRLKNEAIEAKQQGLLGIFVWQQAVMRYLEEFADKRSLSDDKDHLKKLDPYLRSLKLDAIDMTVLQPFIRESQGERWCLERDDQSRTRGGSADIECRASGLAMAQRGAEDSDAEGTPAARAVLETRGGGSIDRGLA